ncbi:MAG: pyridoxal phosphate-dependent aminotransferase [Actinobacteria bacterium]|nr:pyridoxal phosphate-dependent aminotransferase [Actinomycetota bacterium]
MHPFDQITLAELQRQPGVKWHHFDPDVIALWVADMDFPVAPEIVAALQERAGGYLGYSLATGEPGLLEAILERMAARYGWRLGTEELWLINGVIPSLYLAVLACSSAGDEVIIQTPIYPPFISAVKDTGRLPRYNPLVVDNGQYQIDFLQLEALVTPATRVLLLCHPHNPTGRVFNRKELERLADFVLRHNLWVLSDELHSDLLYPGEQHLPLASLHPEIAQRTITVFGPTKAFNIAGLKIGIVVSQNAALLARLKRHARGLVTGPNVMAQVATMAAYRQGQPWLELTLRYLDGNRRFLGDYLPKHLPGVGYLPPQATYLAWLDFRALGLGDRLCQMLLNDCRVGLNDGPQYGPGFEGFARLNFATPRHILAEALHRLTRGLAPYLG